MTQTIATYILLSLALVFLVYKFFIPKKKKGETGKDCDKCE